MLQAAAVALAFASVENVTYGVIYGLGILLERSLMTTLGHMIYSTLWSVPYAVTRNKNRFPEDFMFRLTKEEYAVLRSQFVTSRWGGTRYPPRAFTEHGILMLSNVLKSERAVQVEYPNNPSFQ